MSPEFLERTRSLSVTLTALLCMWLFGNLYEGLVTNPQLIANPRPGTFVGEFAVGSPVYYYLPWAPFCVILMIVLRVRFGRGAPARVRRAWNGAIGFVVVAVIAKVVLITQVNPVFRDPAVSGELVRDRAVWWAFGNGVATIAVAAAVVLLTFHRRPSTVGDGVESR
ncbi:hypothetical protein [Streptosporangium lutulentum]|uniref:Uncharacterized protein n=1 Tax=Streptosporangium lutulentum TaxID=1461250 RepID=A0ABT9QN37_9ACTN|nr:hypothetical protein [Streptosporangium lutulentum]MDP9847668.1 hypothetical protein [Streptosporangium lutulentum]